MTDRSKAKLIHQAINNEWPMSKRARRMAMRKMFKIVESSEHERNRIAAARVMVAADGVNAKRESTIEGTGANVAVQVNVAGAISDAIHEPDYLDYLEQRRLAGHSDAGTAGVNGQSGPMANGSAPASAKPCTNGHHNGTNGKHTDRGDASPPRQE